MKKELFLGLALLQVGCGLGAAVPALKDVRLGGVAGRKMQTFFAERIFGPNAQGKIYDEAANAFRTHYDDPRVRAEQAVSFEPWAAGKGLWQGEYWGKTMLSAAVVCDYAQDAALRAWLKDRALAFVATYQRPDGYLGSYADPFFVGGPDGRGGEVFCWNLWGRKYTLWALLELARVTDAPALLDAAARVMDQEMAQLAEKHIALEDTGYFAGLPSMSVLKPLILLYRATGHARYRAFARRIVAAWERAGNPAPNLVANAFTGWPVHSWYPNPARWAKAYEMMSCLEGLIAYAQLEGEPRILDAVRRIVAQLEIHELNVLGSVGFFDHFTDASACVNATTEPCDVTHWIRVNRELFLATDDAHYLDTLERAYHNAFLAGVYRDGRWGAHSVRSHGTRHRTAPHQVGMRYHQCCIDNMPRTFMDVAQTVATRAPDGALSVNLYADAEVALDGATLALTGNYPYGNAVRVAVRAPRAGRIRFRVPACFDALSIDGRRAEGPWQTLELPAGERVFRLVFARTPRVRLGVRARAGDVRAAGFETVYENPEMKGRARTTPGVTVSYGPLLLAKGRYAGTAPEEIFRDRLTDASWQLSLEPRASVRTDGAWRLTLAHERESFTLDVGDFASIADADDPANAFSVWF